MISGKRKHQTQISLARAISKLGVASRAQARRMIQEGVIEVNGKQVRNPDVWLDPRVDRITRNGSPLEPREKIYLALHKPAGVVTTRSDERGRTTVYDLLPPDFPWVFPVGRLDKDSSGLLLLTNDTDFGEAVTSPDRKVEKHYRVVLDRSLTDQERRELEAGMILPDGTSVAGAIVLQETTPAVYEIRIHEGKNRQIRKMLKTLGHEVRKLHRVSIGKIRLGDLEEGTYRSLSPHEKSSILGQR